MAPPLASAISSAYAPTPTRNHQTDHHHQEGRFRPCSVRSRSLQRAGTPCPRHASAEAGDLPRLATLKAEPLKAFGNFPLYLLNVCLGVASAFNRYGIAAGACYAYNRLPALACADRHLYRFRLS